MTTANTTPSKRPESLQELLQRSVYVLLISAFVLSGALIIASDVLLPSTTKVELEVGSVAPRDLLAPRSLKYESVVLTEAKRQAEIARVRPVYDPPDPSVMSMQLQLARQILDFIENILHDDFATYEQKQRDIRAITELSLDDHVVAALAMVDDDARWRAIDDQIIRLLERVMSGEVREDTIQAERDDLENRISASYNEAEVQIITGIVSDLIRVNAFYNEELTRQAQLDAASNVPVEVRTFVEGQMIVREGEIVTEAHIEALEQFGLLQVARRKVERLVGGVVAMGLVAVLLGVYIYNYHPKIVLDPPFLVLLAVLFLMFLAGAQFTDAESRTHPYYFPAAAFALLMVTLVDSQFAIVASMTLAAVIGITAGKSLEFAVLIALGNTIGVLSLGRTDRLNTYFRAGMLVGVTGVFIALMFALAADDTPSLATVFWQVTGALINGFFSAAVALMGLYLISNMLNIPTSLKIVELQQPNHPLLQRLLREAPGTYQHSLQVANLAELGAQRIGANASLVRVAAMYHDVGKILNPHFFVENQANLASPHEALDDPLQSARIILGHVTEGDRLARRYHLPRRIRDFIMEHHGTTRVIYFYQQALEQAQESSEPVDPAAFTYPGPRPRSRETAILMLADGCESSVRARRPQSRDDIAETVDYIFESRLKDRQLDDSNLTLNDLRMLRDAFLTALQGVFHPRIAYPGSPGQEKLTTGDQPALLEQSAARGRDTAAGDPRSGAIEQGAVSAVTRSIDDDPANRPQSAPPQSQVE